MWHLPDKGFKKHPLPSSPQVPGNHLSLSSRNIHLTCWEGKKKYTLIMLSHSNFSIDLLHHQVRISNLVTSSLIINEVYLEKVQPLLV